MGAAIFTAQKLRSDYNKMRAGGSLGGSGLFFRFEQMAMTSRQGLNPDQKVVCSALAGIFDKIAKRQEGEAVSPEEAETLFAAIDQPVAQCLDYMVGIEFGLTGAELSTSLNNAFDAWAYGK